MAKTIRFGGRPTIAPVRVAPIDSLTKLLRELSWKYVKQEAEFGSSRSVADLSPDELKEKIAHWAGRVWIHSNSMPTGAALQTFDLLSLEDEFRTYIEIHGQGAFAQGLTLEEIWGSQQLYTATPMLTVVARCYMGLLTPLMEPTRVHDSQAIVWTLAAICFQLPHILDGNGFNVLVSDGRIGHTIYIKGLNGIDFVHPRGVRVRAGWFSFHDPWPARSLLAPERDFSGVRVLEDITRPPMWLISPADLEKVIVGYLLPIDVLAAFLEIFRVLDIVERMHVGSALPLWVDEYSPDTGQPFATLFSLANGVAPTTAEGLLGLGRVRLLLGNLQGAIECFEGAYNLRLPDATGRVASLLSAAGHSILAKKWAKRRP